MAKEITKKLVSFVKSTLIDRLVKDEACVENRSDSAIIEKHLLDSFLPENPTARSIAENSLYADNGVNGIGKALSSIFGICAAGAGSFSSKYDNLFPLVQFAQSEECFCNTVPTGKEPEICHFRTQLDYICTNLERLARESSDDSRKYYYEKEASYARALLKEATSEPEFMHYCNFYQLVLDNWEDLKGWSITYRMLSDLAAMETGWNDSSENRVKLLRLLKEVSAEWNDQVLYANKKTYYF